MTGRHDSRVTYGSDAFDLDERDDERGGTDAELDQMRAERRAHRLGTEPDQADHDEPDNGRTYANGDLRRDSRRGRRTERADS